MKSYISRKLPVATRITGIILAHWGVAIPGISVRLFPTVMHPGVLPSELQSKLNLARCCRGLIQPCRKRTAIGVEDRVILTERVQETRRQKVRVIQDVKEFGAKLYVEGFAKANVLEDGQVPRREPRSRQAVPSQIPKNVRAELLTGRSSRGVCG